jgi:hypothetical protein
MLISRPTKFGAGITLAGDSLDLSALRETVRTLASETGCLPANQCTFVLALAFELRKACEGKRDQWEPRGLEPENYLGFNSLWPIFLVQLGMLRSTCAYRPTDRRMQAHLYALEACAADALAGYDPAVGAICMRWLADFNIPHQDFLLSFVSYQSKDFVFGAESEASRFRRLPKVLDEISPHSSTYKKFARAVTEQAHTEGADAQEMADWSEWPDFNW